MIDELRAVLDGRWAEVTAAMVALGPGGAALHVPGPTDRAPTDVATRAGAGWSVPNELAALPESVGFVHRGISGAH